MLPDIPFALNSVIIDQIAFSLVDICLDNMLQILWKSFLCFAKIGETDYSKVTKIWLVEFSVFKIAYLVQFSTDFNNLDLKVLAGICSKQKKF